MKKIWIVAALCAALLNFDAAQVAAANCVDSGPATVCQLGDIGPGGGKVFYDAGSLQWWGRYLEFANTKINSTWTLGAFILSSIYADGTFGLSKAQQQLRSKTIGMGKLNTAAIIAQQNGPSAAKRASDYRGADLTDWYLPSKDELNALYDWSALNKKAAGPAPRWSSSEAGDGFAWYQLFADGTQFTDANGIIASLTSNKLYSKTPEHIGPGFKPVPIIATSIRSFPITSGIPPSLFLAPADPKQNASCLAGGVCNLGDVGPGGGIVFYDAGRIESWGRYFEVAPISCEASGLPFKIGNKKLYAKLEKGHTAAESRLIAKRVGMGQINTHVLTVTFGQGEYAAKFSEDSVCGGKNDWFLPSKDELDLAYNSIAQNRPKFTDLNPRQTTPLGGFDKGYYWTSTDYNGTTAWTQYFIDGQQFDRVQTLAANKLFPFSPFKVRPVRAFG